MHSSYAQCPPNVGFDDGTFDNWSFDTASIFSKRELFKQPLSSPVAGRYIMYKRDGLFSMDPYGVFPVNCPNGSDYSIRIGNDGTGEVTAISYTINIPADKNLYSIIYNYALVLQNPNHADFQQPRFMAKVFDVATNEYLTCSSFDFAGNSGLPGFITANDTVRGAGVVYKPWSPVTIKLAGYAGRQVRIEFIVNDCLQGGHFGYAYLDVNEDCSSPIKGNIVCEGSNSTLLTAPFGFQEYNWYNKDFSVKLGDKNTFFLSPAIAGTELALEVRPYPGSGCVDTLYTTIQRIDVPLVFNAKDTMGSCAPETIDLTKAIAADSTPGLSYLYYNNPSLTGFVPFAQRVSINGTYYIIASNDTGCISMKPVVVIVDTVPVLSILDPPGAYYPNTVDITNPALVNVNVSGLGFYYWKDAAATIPLPNPTALATGGIYYIEARTRIGCSIVKPIRVAVQIPPPPNVFSPNGDGINDRWEIRGLSQYPECSVQIFDRSGRQVFRSAGYNISWDGTLNGKPLPVATYYYIIKVSDLLNPLAGSVTILK